MHVRAAKWGSESPWKRKVETFPCSIDIESTFISQADDARSAENSQEQGMKDELPMRNP
jgi:hypothetical protein